MENNEIKIILSERGKEELSNIGLMGLEKMVNY
jgi:hypothetical protein